MDMDVKRYELKKKILGCWTGKNIGGTLGGPYEGLPGTHQLTFYNPVPTEPLPNDDLDLQVLFLEYLLNNYKDEFSPKLLQQAWADHCEFPWDEYGVCRRNTQLGLRGVDAGTVDNWFADGMGAAIRTELWACLAPGDPDRATGFAWADAVCDHCSDGVWATLFIAAIEAKAFVESDKVKLIDCGLSYIPPECRVSKSVRFTIEQWNKQDDFMAVRHALVDQFGTTNFTDVAANMGIIVLAWLSGKGDFGKTLCNAVNCGLDTDCTCATLGSILGIIDPECIPQNWKEPVGDEIRLSPGLYGLEPPANLDELTEKTMQLSDRLKGENPAIGDVKPRQRGGYPIPLTYQKVGSDIFEKDSLSVDPLANEAMVPGHWFDAGSLIEEAEAVLLNFRFELEEDTTVRFMAYYEERAKIWVNGDAYAEYDPSAWPEGYHGPSFHRFEDYSPAVFLPQGTHSLMVALSNQKPESREVVVGVGDAEKNLWISNALVSVR
jgi:ADP-ribosylglycohydrolase